MRNTGREAGEEEGPQGPREEACHLHPPLRKRRHDRRQAQDEPQPDLLSCQPRVEPVTSARKNDGVNFEMKELREREEKLLWEVAVAESKWNNTQRRS